MTEYRKVSKKILFSTSLSVLSASGIEAMESREEEKDKTKSHDSPLVVKAQDISELKQKPKGFLPDIGANDPKILGKEFLENPQAVLNRFGLGFIDALCPEEVHEAKRRADVFSEDVQRNFEKSPLNEELIRELKIIATKHFGEDFEVETIPYGLKFIEKQQNISENATVSGTGTITFLDSDSDVDG